MRLCRGAGRGCAGCSSTPSPIGIGQLARRCRERDEQHLPRWLRVAVRSQHLGGERDPGRERVRAAGPKQTRRHVGLASPAPRAVAASLARSSRPSPPPASRGMAAAARRQERSCTRCGCRAGSQQRPDRALARVAELGRDRPHRSCPPPSPLTARRATPAPDRPAPSAARSGRLRPVRRSPRSSGIRSSARRASGPIAEHPPGLAARRRPQARVGDQPARRLVAEHAAEQRRDPDRAADVGRRARTASPRSRPPRPRHPRSRRPSATGHRGCWCARRAGSPTRSRASAPTCW